MHACVRFGCPNCHPQRASTSPSPAPPLPSRGPSRSLCLLQAQLINYGTQNLSWGWRLSLGLAGVPAFILLIGSEPTDGSAAALPVRLPACLPA